MKKPHVTFLLLIFAVLPLCAEVVVEQNVITGVADYGSGAGQSFLLPAGKTVSAIQLHIGSLGNGGGSIKVQLWRASGAPGSYFTRLDSDPVTSGLLDRTDVAGTPDWFTIHLDEPFTNNGRDPIYLVFEMELLTSGSAGWNNYSYSNQNSYDGGHSVYWSEWNGNQYVIIDGQDLTFRVLNKIPEGNEISLPKLEFSFEPTAPGRLASSEVLIRESVVGYEYTCFMSEDLSLPRDQWDELWTEIGYGGPVNWGLGYGSVPTSVFFFVEVKPAK